MKQPPPLYVQLVQDMGFDPDVLPDHEFGGWGLDEAYPPTLGELVGGLHAKVAPALIEVGSDE